MMKRLLRWKSEKKRKPLLLKGVRQVGKTHLLKTFGKNHFSKCHYFNFEKQPDLAKVFEENLDPQRILDDLSFYIGSKIEVGKDLVIFDEIQQLPKALTSLKYFQEDCSKLHLCAAGSLLGLHLSPGSFPVGKVTFETLRPMSFEEFLMAQNDKALPLSAKNSPKSSTITFLSNLKNISLLEVCQKLFPPTLNTKKTPSKLLTKLEKNKTIFSKPTMLISLNIPVKSTQCTSTVFSILFLHKLAAL